MTRRSRVLAAPADDVWAVLADPWSLPRWWPFTVRVEGVDERGWTTVLSNEHSGRSLRADWILESSQAPSHRRWTQDLEGTPFQRLFAENTVDARLEPEDGGTRIVLAFEQRVRGWARLVPFVVRKAMRKQLGEALEALAEAVER